ncbi:hypothetical protein [Enterovibrio norvegicus]|uniref:hypothetical protein n=1 Tax=Enterovibrio norvegicus TaxID=188144 RepID=UPI000C8171CC|nr:hypothetical protein [Enterovibrio norvegicus]PMH64523.1 hypothetical protein BCU62_15830 [Enterovibrio norvegicus]
MYHGEKTVIGRYLITGNNRAEVSQHIKSLNKQAATEIFHELYADLFYKRLNKLSKGHVERLEKIRNELKKGLESEQFSPMVNQFGNQISRSGLPRIEIFFRLFSSYKIEYQNAFRVIATDVDSLKIAVFIEGDLIEVKCTDREAFNTELIEYLYEYV